MIFEDIAVGDALPSITKGPMSSSHIMRWSAAIENWHPLHYDWKYATGHDGLPDILVSGSWKQQFLLQLLSDWVDETGWILRASLQYRRMNVPGDTITAWGIVTGKRVCNGFGVLDLDIGLRDQNDIESTPGRATVVLPLRGGRPVPYPFDPRALENG